MSWQDVRYVPRVLAAINFMERPSHFSLECEVPYNVVCILIQGGNNAGHTVKVGSQAYAFHLLPRYVAWHIMLFLNSLVYQLAFYGVHPCCGKLNLSYTL